jgi:peptidoglycan/xylan/chitin deacetylase (PgdA/CDA1 family)
MLKQLKRATLGGLRAFGVFTLMRKSKWRQERLLILAYHGLSIIDEHEWNPQLFMNPEVFRERMRILKKSGYTVLPLEEAIHRLYSNDLPENCVALTFDDGYYDFYKCARPILKEFDFPVTLYLTTFYVHYNRPVFEEICPYLLWKGRHLTLDLREVIGLELKLDLTNAAEHGKARNEILAFARQHKLSAEEKDALAAKLARQIKVDYGELCANRILHLLTPGEASQLAAEGVDIQLHTHNHLSPLDRRLFHQEIEDNRSSIRAMTGYPARHFCYPSGFYHESFFPWLDELEVTSATTCDVGLASQSSHRLLLPRLVDTSLASPVEFEGWLTGVATFLPRGHRDVNKAA